MLNLPIYLWCQFSSYVEHETGNIYHEIAQNNFCKRNNLSPDFGFIFISQPSVDPSLISYQTRAIIFKLNEIVNTVAIWNLTIQNSETFEGQISNGPVFKK